MTVRLAHATDIHWFAAPRLSDVSVKRVFGTINLYAMGRRDEYDEAVQAALVEHLLALEPDAVLLTGDLTAQALVAEFAKARAALQPLLDRVPTLILPGNHDVYAPDAVAEGRFHAAFGPWAGGRPLARLDVGPLTLLGLDPCRPTLVTAAGRIPASQHAALVEALADPALRDRIVVLGLHYPPVDRAGEPYVKPSHGLLDARELIAELEAAPKRPALVCCGHVHHGYRADLVLADGARVPVSNCGTSGHSYQPERGRWACCALYDLDETGVVGWHLYAHDGARFVEVS